MRCSLIIIVNYIIIIYFVLSTDLENREKLYVEPVHIINIDVQDNHEEATIGAIMICDLCTLVNVIESIVYFIWHHNYLDTFIVASSYDAIFEGIQ